MSSSGMSSLENELDLKKKTVQLRVDNRLFHGSFQIQNSNPPLLQTKKISIFNRRISSCGGKLVFGKLVIYNIISFWRGLRIKLAAQ